jgi:hypothetical protein
MPLGATETAADTHTGQGYLFWAAVKRRRDFGRGDRDKPNDFGALAESVLDYYAHVMIAAGGITGLFEPAVLTVEAFPFRDSEKPVDSLSVEARCGVAGSGQNAPMDSVESRRGMSFGARPFHDHLREAALARHWFAFISVIIPPEQSQCVAMPHSSSGWIIANSSRLLRAHPRYFRISTKSHITASQEGRALCRACEQCIVKRAVPS